MQRRIDNKNIAQKLTGQIAIDFNSGNFYGKGDASSTIDQRAVALIGFNSCQ